jgi:hypothetical protein
MIVRCTARSTARSNDEVGAAGCRVPSAKPPLLVNTPEFLRSYSDYARALPRPPSCPGGWTGPTTGLPPLPSSAKWVYSAPFSSPYGPYPISQRPYQCGGDHLELNMNSGQPITIAQFVRVVHGTAVTNSSSS